MTTISIKIPEDKKAALSSYVKKIGGEVVANSNQLVLAETEDEVTHESFFGENIKRVIRAFKA